MSADPQSDIPALTFGANRPHPRWRIVRDVIGIQVKLVLGNVHNFVLMPVCVFAAALDILFKNRRDEAWLYKALAWGRHLEEKIGLYSSLHDDLGQAHNPREAYSVDALMARIEAAVKREHEKGGTVASVKNAVDSAIERAAAEAARHKDKVKEKLDRAAEKIRPKSENNAGGEP